MCLKDPQNHPLKDSLPDGTEVRLVPPERTKFRPLYISADGRPFSHVWVKDKSTGQYRWEFHLLAAMPDTSKTNKYNGNRKQKYLKMGADYGHILVHTAVALAWIGDKPGSAYGVDHLNGITSDNRVENLQWITPAENHRRAVILRALRKNGSDPQTMSREELLATFAEPLTHVPGDQQIAREMSQHMEV